MGFYSDYGNRVGQYAIMDEVMVTVLNTKVIVEAFGNESSYEHPLVNVEIGLTKNYSTEYWSWREFRCKLADFKLIHTYPTGRFIELDAYDVYQDYVTREGPDAKLGPFFTSLSL